MMEIPRDMKGLEKSITSSRTNVMVSGATAISAFCKEEGKGQGLHISHIIAQLTSQRLHIIQIDGRECAVNTE